MLSWESLHSEAVGGIAVHVTELAAALRLRGHEVHVFTRWMHDQRFYERIGGVHYHRCPYPAAGDFVDDVNNMCRAFVERVYIVEDMIGHFDLIHAHDWLAANAMIWIKQGRHHPCVLTIHSSEYARCGNAFPSGRSTRIREQERAGTYWADKVICVSHSTKSEMMWMYEVPEWKIHVVYNGVAVERFNMDVDIGTARRRYDVGPMDPTILFCGRIEWQKGPDLLVEAIPRILHHHANAKFLFVGGGGMRPGLERRAWDIGAGHAVRWAGFRNGTDIVELYKLCDGVCVPSRNEPFGIVILEAWSAGKPVVATDCGGPREIVRHEYNGLSVSPNPDSIAWGLGALFSDFERARWMGDNGRREVDGRFAWVNIAQRTAEVYESVVPQAARSHRPPGAQIGERDLLPRLETAVRKQRVRKERSGSAGLEPPHRERARR